MKRGTPALVLTVILPAACVSLGAERVAVSETDRTGVSVNSRLAAEVNAVGSYSHLDGWGGSRPPLPRNSAGMELFTTFADTRGDFLSADLQVRLASDERARTDSSWAIEVHNAWLRWKPGLGQYLRAGHFSPAYGLEPVSDTHGRMLQTLAMQDIGFKHDWGIGYEGIAGPLDFRTAAQLGSGMGIRYRRNRYLLSARIGSPESDHVRWGISALHGLVFAAYDHRLIPAPEYHTCPVPKDRLGADLRVPVGPVETSTELTWGRDNSSHVLGALTQIRLESVAATRWNLALQGRYWADSLGEGMAEGAQVATVLEYPVSPGSTVRVGYFHDVADMFGAPLDRLAVLQFYHLGL